MKNEIVAIYGLVDPRDESVFYVGSSLKPKVRFRMHISPFNKANAGVKRVVDELRTQGRQPGLRILEECSFWIRYQREWHWILKLHKEGHKLTNKNALTKSGKELYSRMIKKNFWQAP